MNYAEEIGKILIEQNMDIATVESCTGGLLSSKLTDISGSSAYIKLNLVTYANEAKVKYLGVSEESIEKYGVVSEPVASRMAEGVASANGCEVGVAVSGIAGPTGAVPGKPVGTVCFGYYINGSVYAETVFFGDLGRNIVRKSSVSHVYSRLVELLSEQK